MIIDLIADDVPSIALLNAVAACFPKKDLKEILGLKDSEHEVEVKLTVNGVEVPFGPALEHLWSQIEKRTNEQALDLLNRAISGAGMAELFDALRAAEWQVVNAVQKAMEKLES